MKKVFLIFTTASLLFNLSCSKDDDHPETIVSPEAKAAAEAFITGIWRMTDVTFEGKPFDQQCLDKQVIIFKKDNSAIYSFTEVHLDEATQTCQSQEVNSGSFSWVVSAENKITLSDTDEKGEKYELDLLVQDDTFILEFVITDELYDTVEVYEHTFKREDTE